jgi:formylglycine-generating enzyme required for sulfatase activity/uncharacterized caspase-like protein
MTSKFALVIANTDYQDASFAKLTAPGKDAEEFAQVLRELAAFDDVQILLNEGESKTRRSIARFFTERKRDDLLLLYFSGHGVRNEQGQLFLAANDTEISILEASGIPADFVTSSMNNSRSQRQLLILDCCNSGAFAHGSKSATGVGKSMGIATAFEGSGFGRVVLTATDATQYAWEGDKVIGDTQKSVFTHFLIEGLKGDADRDGDGHIDVDELYDYAYEQIVRRTPKQTPGKWSYRQQGDIVLRENLKPREVKPTPLPSELIEMLSHPNSGVRRAAIQDLISLLEGKHLGLARAAEEKLREIAENDDSLTLRRSASETLIAHGIMMEQPVPVEIAKEKQPEEKPIVSIEKKTELENLSSQAIQYELNGDFWNALQTYYQINKIDPLFPRVDVKIAELERELRPKPVPVPKEVEIGKSVVDNKQILSNRRISLRVIGGFVAILFVLGVFIFRPALDVIFASPTPSSTQTSQLKATDIPLPIETLLPPITGKDGMTLLYVPAGKFKMGSDDDLPDEKPLHTVYLDAFRIDKTEVTNAKYAKCVQDGKCKQPSSTSSETHYIYYENSEFDNYPVIYVNWDDANAYCAWAGRRLPTEAEWEKAARGTDGRTYPWGNDSPNDTLLNYNNYSGQDTKEVGKYPNGASPYGALDMAGNVSEWVADWYDESYYATLGEKARNPQGPANGQVHVLRGGSYFSNYYSVRSSERTLYEISGPVLDGFRCAVSESEATQSAQSTQAAPETPSPTQTSIVSAPTLSIGSTKISDKDGMTLLYVPAGEFMMGNKAEDVLAECQKFLSDCKLDSFKNEGPPHTISLDAFWIDQTEVTVQMYYFCVQAGVCREPTNKTSHTHATYYGDPEFDNHPVIYVDWNMARTYCKWVSRRLPTEAEWEKAARGTDQRTYPWGNEIDKTFANYNSFIGDTTSVASYESGKSLYGAYDMAGNVWEWVSSLYQSYPYSATDGREDMSVSGQRVLRGGSWYNNGVYVRSDVRYWYDPINTFNDLGFRCAMSATP